MEHEVRYRRAFKVAAAHTAEAARVTEESPVAVQSRPKVGNMRIFRMW